MMRCYQPPRYGERDCPRLPREWCGEKWRVCVTPLCPVEPGGSQRDAAMHALRVYAACWSWRAGAAGMSTREQNDLREWAEVAP